MQQKYLYGIIGLLSGILIAILFSTSVVNSNNTNMMSMMGFRANQNMMQGKNEMMGEANRHGMGSSMDEMMESLSGKTGDDFDSAFIDVMIIHHQGAIEMAKEAQTSATHQEIKDLADDIISAQTKEIEMMREWKKQWGY